LDIFKCPFYKSPLFFPKNPEFSSVLTIMVTKTNENPQKIMVSFFVSLRTFLGTSQFSSKTNAIPLRIMGSDRMGRKSAIFLFPFFQFAQNVQRMSVTIYGHKIPRYSTGISTKFQHRPLISPQTHLNNNVVTMYNRWTNHRPSMSAMDATIYHII
jgi:hypothetical protein